MRCESPTVARRWWLQAAAGHPRSDGIRPRPPSRRLSLRRLPRTRRNSGGRVTRSGGRGGKPRRLAGPSGPVASYTRFHRSAGGGMGRCGGGSTPPQCGISHRGRSSSCTAENARPTSWLGTTRQNPSIDRRALITGIAGQDGSLLAEDMLAEGYAVYGIVRQDPSGRFPNLEDIRPRVELLPADLLDQDSLVAVLEACEPHEVYNLASPSFVPLSWAQPVLTAEFAAVGVTAILEAIRQVDRRSASTRHRRARSSAIRPRRRRRRRRRSRPRRRTVSPRRTATSSRRRTVANTASTHALASSTTTSHRGVRWTSCRGRWRTVPRESPPDLRTSWY